MSMIMTLTMAVVAGTQYSIALSMESSQHQNLLIDSLLLTNSILLSYPSLWLYYYYTYPL